MVQDNVSSSMIGEMRMQFWRDAVKSLVDVRCHLIHYFTGRECDIGQTPASPHRPSSARRNATYPPSIVSPEENCRRQGLYL